MDINLQNLINRVTTLENLLQRLLRYLNPTGGGSGDSNNYQTQIDNLQDEINGLKKNSTRLLEIVNDTVSVNVNSSGDATVANNENSTLKLKIGSADATITDVRIASGTGSNLTYNSFPYSYFSLSSNLKTITTSIPESTHIGVGTKAYTIKVTGTYNNISFSEEATLKIVGMTMGDPEANYDLKVSASTIKQDNDGNNSPSSIDVYILKSRKGIFTKMRTDSFDDNNFSLQYKIDNGTFTTVPASGISTAGVISQIVVQALYKGAIFDEEIIHVVKDGIDGDSTPCSFSVDNDTISIDVDADGIVTEDNTSEDSIIYLYYGTNLATIDKIEYDSNNEVETKPDFITIKTSQLSTGESVAIVTINPSKGDESFVNSYLSKSPIIYNFKVTGKQVTNERTINLSGIIGIKCIATQYGEYNLRVSSHSIKSGDKNDPEELKVWVVKNNTKVYPLPNDLSISYQFKDSLAAKLVSLDSTTSEGTIDVSATQQPLTITLNSSREGTIDSEYIGITRDGNGGKAVILIADNSTISVDVDVAGNVTSDNSSEDCTVSLNYGEDTFNCELSVNSDNSAKCTKYGVTLVKDPSGLKDITNTIRVNPSAGTYYGLKPILISFNVKAINSAGSAIGVNTIFTLKLIPSQYGEYDLITNTSIIVRTTTDGANPVYSPDSLQYRIQKKTPLKTEIQKTIPSGLYINLNGTTILPSDTSDNSYNLGDTNWKTISLNTLDFNKKSYTIELRQQKTSTQEDQLVDSSYITLTTLNIATPEEKQGLNGAVMRNRGIYDSTTSDYVNQMNDKTEGLAIRYMDYVIYPEPSYANGESTNSPNYYLVNPEYGELGSDYSLPQGLTPDSNYIADSDFTSANSTTKQSKAWIKASKMSFAYIQNLIADYIDSKTITANEVLVKGTTDSGDTNIVGGLINGGSSSVNDTDADKVILFAGTNSTKGSINVREAPFYVTKAGLMRAIKASISGDIMAETFTAGLDSSRFQIKLGDDALQFFYNGTAYASLEYGEKTINGTTATTVWLGIWVNGTGWKWIDLGNAMKTEGESTTYTDIVNLYSLSGGGIGTTATETQVNSIRLGSDGKYYVGSNTASLSLLSGVYYELQDSYASIVVNSSYINTYDVIQRGRIYNKVSFTNGDKTSSSIYVVTIPRGVEMGDHQLNFNGERIFVKKASTINADNDFYSYLGSSGKSQGIKVTVNSASGTYYYGQATIALTEVSSTDLTKLVVHVPTDLIETTIYNLAYLNTKKFSTALNAKKLNFNE